MKTKTENARRRRILVWTIIVIAAAVLLTAAFFLDHIVFNWVEQHSTRAMRNAGRFISHYGDWLEHCILGAVLVAIASLFHNKQWARIFLCMLIACAFAGLSARAIKYTTGRARPKIKNESVWNGVRFDSAHTAFPSGHTAASAGFFGALFFARRKIGAPFLVVPLIIGAARVCVGAHYLSDVAFAFMLGLFCAFLVSGSLKLDDPQSAIGN